MTLPSPGITKEIRALLPLWSACLFVLTAGEVTGSAFVRDAGVLVYGLGSIALGALSIGHEYAHHTLGLLLSHPIHRRRILLTKLVVLAVMLAILTAVAAVTALDRDGMRYPPRPGAFNAIYLAAAVGLFLTPYLTMVSRTALAAIVFSVAIPGVLFVIGDALGLFIYSVNQAADVDRFTLAFFWRSSVLVIALAAIAGWRRFMRLQAIEGYGAQMHLPVMSSSAGTRPEHAPRRHPVWMLVLKEIRIQQMSFVVAALYPLGWIAAAYLKRESPGFSDLPLDGLTVLYAGILALLIGSLASAEERQFGTIEWQSLQPISRAAQWAIKVGVVLALTLFLGVAVPAGLHLVIHAGADPRLTGSKWLDLGTLMVVLTACGLYASTLCASGVKALAVAFPIAAGLGIFAMWAIAVVWRVLATAFHAPRLFLSMRDVDLAATILPVGLVALLLFFGFRNHGSSERNARTVLAQAGWLAASVVVGLIGLAVVRIGTG